MLSKSKPYHVAFQTLLVREVRRFIRIWPQTLLPPAITMTLYFLIFGTLMGERIGEMGGISYIEYIAPGIIMMSVINNSYANVVSSFFSAKLHGHLEELIIAPIPNYLIIAGYVSGGVVRGMLVGAIVTTVAFFFTELSVQNIFLTLGVIFLSAILFSLAGLINAIYARSFDDISIIPTFILTPLTYLGGVFYTIDLLPDFWQYASKLNPILYMVNSFRYGILGLSDVPITVAVVLILLFIVALSSIALYLLNKGIGIKS